MISARDVARVAHEANRAYQVVSGDPVVSPEWDDAPAWQQESAVAGVESAMRGASPEDLHEEWCAFKRADGWVYGEEKDAAARTHPCLVSYADLPNDQRRKDALFHAVFHALT